MARPIWKGFITFGLVNIPIILYSAEKKYDIHFKLLDSRDKSRIRYIRINEQTGEEVPWSEIAKGYEYDGDNYLVLKKEDIQSIAGENTKTINIEAFVKKNSLDYIIFDKPYYVLPDKKGDKAYVLLRETLKNTNMIGIAKVMIHTRQYLAAVITFKNAIILNTIRYQKELRQASEFELPSDNLKDYKISKKELDIAKQLVASMTSKWDPSEYQDEFQEALHAWIDEKIHHEKPSKKSKMAQPPKEGKIVDFVELLKKSLKNSKKSTKKEQA